METALSSLPACRGFHHPARPRIVRGAALAAVLAALLSIVGVAQAPTSHAATEDCTYSVTSSTACIKTTLQVDKPEQLSFTVQGPSEEQTVHPNPDGSLYVVVKEAGTYTVTLDKESLSEGLTPTPGTKLEQKIDVQLGSTALVQPLTFTGTASNSASSQNAGASSGFDYWKKSAAYGLRLGLLLALASVGLSLIYGTTKISSFSHGEQVTLGGLLGYVIVVKAGLPLILGGIVTVALCAATGLIQDFVLWRPLRKRGLGLAQLMIITIGLSLSLQFTFQYFLGASTVQVSTSINESVMVWGIPLSTYDFVAMGLSLVVIAGMGLFLTRTRIGRATRAVSDNPDLAAASGIDQNKVVRLVWVLACALAGLAGLMWALVMGGVSWQTGMQTLLLMFAAVTLGGLGTAFGAFVGAIVIGLVVELSTPLGIPGDLKYATALAILIVLLVFRPQGVFGQAERIG